MRQIAELSPLQTPAFDEHDLEAGALTFHPMLDVNRQRPQHNSVRNVDQGFLPPDLIGSRERDGDSRVGHVYGRPGHPVVLPSQPTRDKNVPPGINPLELLLVFWHIHRSRRNGLCESPPQTLTCHPDLAGLDQKEIGGPGTDRKSTRLNSSHLVISYAVFCLKKKKNTRT